MALGTHQQFHSLLSEKKHVLITAGTHTGGDGIASAIATAHFLDTLGVRTDIIIDGFADTERYGFLPRIGDIKPTFEYLKKFILDIDIKKTGIKELSYDVEGDTLRIFLTPKHGELERSNIATSETAYRYDAIVVLGADDLDSVGTLFEQHAPLFFETPLINIGHNASNEQFGNVNIVDVTASSCAEVLYEVFNTVGKEHISEEIAMALLTGMIVKTNSFKQKEVTPKALGIASKLMKLGADRDFIIDKLYRTRTIGALKLWGEALTHLKTNEAKRLVWTSLTREAFVRAGATEHDLQDLVPELISSSPSANVIVILHEHREEATIHGIVYSTTGIDSRELIKSYNPTGTAKAANFYMRDKSLTDVEQLVVAKIESKL